jgi:alanine-synthesizing transaminase
MFARRTDWNLAANRFSQALTAHRAAGKQVLDLSVSNPTAVGIQYDDAGISAALSDPRGMTYHPEPKGMLSARQAIANYYAERHTSPKFSPDVENIVLTASTSEAYSFVFKLLCEPADEVLIPAPSYPLFEFLAAMEDTRLVPYTLRYHNDDGWEMDLGSVERAITSRTRAIIVVHPNNPTGSYVSDEEKLQLNQLCAAHDMAIIADEVFLDFEHSGNVRQSFAGNDPTLTFTLSGLSKISGLPQLKLAWMVMNGEGKILSEARSRLEIVADTFLSVGTPAQLAAPALLAQRHRFQEQLRVRIARNLRRLDALLGAQKLCSRLEVEGGWYAILRVPAGKPDEEIAIHLLQRRGVLVHPGHFYDFPRAGYLVLSLILPPADFASAAEIMLEEIASFFA